MLTQGPAPDPKCKLNFPSILTLPHSLDGPFLLVTWNSVFSLCLYVLVVTFFFSHVLSLYLDVVFAFYLSDFCAATFFYPCK